MIITRGIKNRALSIIGSGMILMFFSEFLFMNEEPVRMVMQLLAPPASAPLELLALSGFYMFAAWALLLLLPYAQPHGLAGIFLAGCLYGWIVEGAVVPAVHEAPPVSWIWTSVSWHAPIDVFIGLFILRRALAAPGPLRSLILHTLAGIGWGVWSTWTWGDPDGLRLTVAEFASFAAMTSILWAIGLFFMARAQAWESTRFERGFVLALAWLLALIWASVALPLSIGVLVLAAIATFAVTRPARTANPALELPLGSFPLWRLTHVFVAALMATGTVWICSEFKRHIATEDVTAIALVGGTIALLWSFWRVFTAR